MNPKIIASKSLVQKLIDLGIVPENCQHIIIDLPVGSVAFVYYRTIADELLLEVEFGPEPKIINEGDGMEELSTRTRHSLYHAGITTAAQLLGKQERELRMINGIGEQSLIEISSLCKKLLSDSNETTA